MELISLQHLPIQPSGCKSPLGELTIALSAGDLAEVQFPDGVDRSLLFDLILGEKKSPRDSVWLLGRSVSALSRRYRRRLRRRIGLVLERDLLLYERTLLENVTLPALIGGADSRLVGRRAARALKELGLLSKSHVSISDLTPRERRLATLGQVIVKSPPLVLASLRCDGTDRDIVKPHLERLSIFGCAVLIATSGEVDGLKVTYCQTSSLVGA